MKIGVLNNLYSVSSHGGGAEKICETVVKQLIKDGHEVFVVTTKSFGFIFPKDGQNGEKIYYLRSLFPDLNKIPIFIRMFWHLVNIFQIINYSKIRAILYREKPDLIISNNLMGLGFLTPKAISKAKIKHFHILHDIQLLHPSGLMFFNQENSLNSFNSRGYQFFTKRLFKNRDLIVSPSKWLLDEHVKRGFFIDAKRVVLSNPIEPMITVDGEVIKDQIGFTFLFIGQIEKHKGIDILLEAFRQVNQTSQLLIVGGGSKFNELKNDYSNDRVKFLGRKNYSEICLLMKQADCLVVPSICYENSPTVIYESVINNLPVIGSACGGIKEILDNDKLLFEPDNIESLKDRLNWVQNNQAELKPNWRTVVEKFKINTPEEYIKKILELVENN